MKIIKDNYSKFDKELIEFKCTCPNCQSILETNENDVQYDREDGEHYIICPCCHMRITDEYFDRKITLDNISYPFDFYQFGTCIESKHLSNEEINKMVKECADFFKYNPDETYRYIGTGDTFIIALNLNEEYYFLVAKNYEEAFVDKT